MDQGTIGRPMEILLVEDSLMSARITIGTLAKSGFDHRLSWVSDGLDAKEFVFREKKYAQAPTPDMILLDLNLPNLSGRELLAKVRGTTETMNIPVVIMTSEPGEEGAREFEGLDVQGFLVKPVNPEEFMNLVEKLKAYWKADMIMPQRSHQS